MRAFIIGLAVLVFCCLTSLAQSDKSTTLKEQATKLKTFFDQHQTEKAYLHFDKPYYAAGDTIYFKAYVVAGEKNALSPLSGVLYADLISPQNTITKAIKLQVIDGLAWGDFALPDSLPGGNYRIRAYTKLMQNYGSEAFFDRVIPIAAIIQGLPSKGPKGTSVATLPDMQFFPEGGELAAGVSSKIAFKAVIPGGAGIDVKGTVFDSKNKIVANFRSAHLGMGVFTFSPVAAETYHADVVYADGTKTSVALPFANAGGVGIAVYDSASKISVHINPSAAFYEQNKNQPLGLFIYSGGRLTTVSDVMDGPDMRFDIQKSGLHSGITQITLLSAKGEPLCERLVFIDKDDKLALTLSADKKQYTQREQVKVKLHLDVGDFDAPAHFSVTVIDRSKVQIDADKEENILTYLLLTSCLKGNIENPGYYFNNTDAQKRAELDLVMLTHGYRRFTWKALANNNVQPPTGQPEKYLTITGMAKSVWGKPINNGLITLIPSAGGGLRSEKTDDKGKFSFGNLVFFDSTRFVLNAVNAKGGNNTQLIYQPALTAPIDAVTYFATTDTSSSAIIQAYLQNSKNRHNDYIKYDGPGRQLKEVVIRAVKTPAYRTASLAGAGNATQVVHMKDVKEAGKLSDILDSRLRVRFYHGVPQLGLIVIDGLQIPSTDIDYINASDVETVELLLGANAVIYGLQGGNGVLVITTKQGSGVDPKDIQSRGVLPLTIAGFYKAREFYAPRYDKVNNHTRPDLRSTIFWLPELMTDKNGDASFDFYNADGIGKYQVIVEGISNDGAAGVVKLDCEVKE